MTEKVVRVAGGQGFWGDLLTAPIDQVRKGPIDYLMLDYLAEVTMSILQKQRNRDPEAGYARDFVSLMHEILPDCVEKNVKVLSNAGGVNVAGCAEKIREAAVELGLSGKVKIGVVTGDDVLSKLDKWIADGVEINSMDDGTPLASIRDKVQSANVYLGAEALVEALGRGARPGRGAGQVGSSTTGTASRPARSRATSSNAVPNPQAATASTIGRTFPTWRISVFR